MAAQTIGTGAVVLTANADRLLAGLNKAERATENWAGKTAKHARGPSGGGGGAGGGLVGGLLFGGAIGLAAGAFMAGIHAAGKAVERFAEIGERAQRYGNLSPDMASGVERSQGAIDRMSGALDEFLFRIAGDLAPHLEKVADVLEVIGFVGAEVFGAAVDLISEIVSSIAEWIDETFGLATATTSAGDQAFAVLRNLGKAAAYYFDIWKAGAGAVVYAAGVIVDGFGQVIQIVASAAKQLDALARELPEAIRPEWVGKAAAAMEGFGAKTEGVGERMQKWGKDAIMGFGKSAEVVDRFFDKVEGKFHATERMAKKSELASGNLLAGAFQWGSSEAVSLVNKFEAGNMVADAQKRQENLLREVRDGINRVEDKIEPLKPG